MVEGKPQLEIPQNLMKPEVIKEIEEWLKFE
jgi:hypothetical protein